VQNTIYIEPDAWDALAKWVQKRRDERDIPAAR
jgi:hypothetical protein